MVGRDSFRRCRHAVRNASADADVACAVGLQCCRVYCAACRPPNYRCKSRVLDRCPCGCIPHVHKLGVLDAESSGHRFLGLPHTSAHRATCPDRLSVLATAHPAHRRLTWFLRKAAASSLEHRLVCKFVRSVVAFWFPTPRTPPLWQPDFFLVNCSVLRPLLASERSGVVKTFRCTPPRHGHTAN